MTVTWAYVYGHPGADPVADRVELDRNGQRTILVPVPDESDVSAVVTRLVADGVQLIELCGGFTVPDVARAIEAAGGRVPVGHVTFGLESVAGAAAYNAQFEQQTTDVG